MKLMQFFPLSQAFVIAEFFLGIFSTVLVIICSIQFHSLQNRARTLDEAKLSALLVIGITLAVFLSLVMYFTCAVGYAIFLKRLDYFFVFVSIFCVYFLGLIRDFSSFNLNVIVKNKKKMIHILSVLYHS